MIEYDTVPPPLSVPDGADTTTANRAGGRVVVDVVGGAVVVVGRVVVVVGVVGVGVVVVGVGVVTGSQVTVARRLGVAPGAMRAWNPALLFGSSG